MPNIPVPAAAEGVPIITQKHVDSSYELLAILDICAFAASYVDQAGSHEMRGRIGGNIGVCLDLARRIATDISDILVMAEGEKS